MGVVTGKEAFFGCLRDEWAPALRRHGFKGSGQRFYRDLGGVVHAIGVQVNKYGGSCCVNIGAHPHCLPLAPVPASSESTGIETRRIRAESCEFRWRLAPPGRTDYWWGYEHGLDAHLPYGMEGGAWPTAADRARHLARMYWEAGEPVFQRLTSAEDFLGLIRLEDIERGYPVSPLYLYTPAKAALSMARLHAHAGDGEAAWRFAEAGLRHLGNATALRAPLKAIAGEPTA